MKWFHHANTNEPISAKFCTKWLYIPRSDIGIFSYFSPLQDDGLFSNVTLHVRTIK